MQTRHYLYLIIMKNTFSSLIKMQNLVLKVQTEMLYHSTSRFQKLYRLYGKYVISIYCTLTHGSQRGNQPKSANFCIAYKRCYCILQHKLLILICGQAGVLSLLQLPTIKCIHLSNYKRSTYISVRCL